MKGEKKVYLVKRADTGATVPVIAEDWPLATVEAARFWAVPWGKYVHQMELERTMDYRPSICIKCGKYRTAMMDEEGTGLCMACKKAAEEEKKLNEARYWKQIHRNNRREQA